MNKINQEYFGGVINKLKQAKASESIILDSSFRDSLRKQLVLQAQKSQRKSFDFQEFFQRGKLLFGLIPTFAILAIVALNFTNLKILFKGEEKMDSVNDNTSLTVEGGSNSYHNQEPNNGWQIKTFPGYLVMPPQYKRGFSLSFQNISQLNFRGGSEKVPSTTPSTSTPAGVSDFIPQEVERITYQPQSGSTQSESVETIKNDQAISKAEPVRNSDSKHPESTSPIRMPASTDTESATPPKSSNILDNFKLIPQSMESEVSSSIKPNDAVRSGNILSPESGLESGSETTSLKAPTAGIESTVKESIRVSASADKIYFNADFNQTEKNILSKIILNEVSRKKTLLEPGYYFKVELLVNGQVQVSLFENNAVSETLLLQKNGESYVVL